MIPPPPRSTDKSGSGLTATIVLLVVFAVLYNMLDRSLRGFLVWVLLAVAGGRLLDLHRQVRILREEVSDLRAWLQNLRVPFDAHPGAKGQPAETAPPVRRHLPEERTVPEESPALPVPPGEGPQTLAGGEAIPGLPHVTAIPAPPRAPAFPPRPPRQPDAVPVFQVAETPRPPAKPDLLTRLKGDNPLARLGIFILFIGASFLAKYAAERQMLPLEVRFAAIAAVSLALLGVGWRLRENQPGYAQILQGGGVAGLYLTAFSATRLFQFLPQGFALAFMTVVAVAAAILAVAQNALPLAVIGTAGGFLAPVLLSTGGGSHVALFSYYTVLNLGILTVAWYRAWPVLSVVGLVFTFSITGAWRATGYRPEHLASAEGFLILFFLLYVAISVLNALRQAPSLKGYVSGSLIFGLPLTAFGLHASLVHRYEYGLAWSALVLGLFYVSLAFALHRSARPNFNLLTEAFAALGVIFASLAVPLAFDHQTTAAMWAVEGAGVLWLGIRQDRWSARAFGVLLQFAGSVGFLLGLHGYHATHPVANSVYVGAVMLAVAGLLSGYWLSRTSVRLAAYETAWKIFAALYGTVWWLFAGLHEIDRFAPAAKLGGSLAFAAATAVLFFLSGTRVTWTLLKRIALVLPGLAMAVGLVYALPFSHPFAAWGWMGWPPALAAHFWLLYRAERDEADAPAGKLTNWLHAEGLWGLAALVAWEGGWQVARVTSGVWPHLARGLAPACFVWLATRPEPRPAWPLARHASAYRLRGAPPLAAWTILWLLWTNFTQNGNPTPLPYLPLANPLDIATLLCLAVLGLSWLRLTDAERRRVVPPQKTPLIAAAAGLVFLCVNAFLIRALHHLAAVPFSPHGIMRSTLAQAALSIFWGLIALGATTVAARRKWRTLWLTGAWLIAVVVAKLFLVDLSGRGTLARIVSFLTVGVLLLVTGYLSPLPPRTESTESTP